jgi:hypothetical protein
MSKAHDPYLQAAEGFLHSIRAELDMADDLEMDRTLRVTQTYALVSIARSLNELIEPGQSEDATPILAAAASLRT